MTHFRGTSISFSVALALLATLIGAVPSYAATIPGAERGTALVQLKDSSNEDALDQFKLLSIEPVGENSPGLYQVELDPFTSFESQIAALAKSEDVSFAEPNYLIQVKDTANDPRVISEETWGLFASSSTSAFGSNAVGAWASGYTGSKAVYVAVIDSGIDVTHPDLAANMWVNSGELVGNGIDDDANGFVDDIHGYDFLNGDGSVFDAGEHPHGTHVAGTIGAVGGNGVGVAGVAWNINLISAKIANSQGASTTVDAIRAIDYVTMLRTKKGLDIIATNNSWGGTGYSKALEDAIKRGGDVGIIFVAAAGNDGQNLDAFNQYPAEYDCTTPHRPFDCVVSVAAIGQNGDLAGYSNYSGTSVDIAAPGTNILSTVPGGYDMLSGTSMAAPHVTGAIALCLASYRGITAKQAIEKLKATAVSSPSFSGKVVTGGHLNVSAMVSSCAQENTALSGALTNHVGSALYTDRARLDWDDTAIGDYEQEIQVSVGPNGCRGTFSHHAYIGPGLTALPVFNLEEAQFYCFRVRAIRDSQTTAWVNSPLFITWTSNLPFISGKVLMNDGVTPVAKMPVKWLAAGAYAGLDNEEALTVYTNLSGEYVLQVPNGTAGDLFINTSRRANRGLDTIPPTPWGMELGGRLTVTQDQVINLTLPPISNINLTVREHGTNAPVSRAMIEFSGNTKTCKSPFPQAFAGATDLRCTSWPGGYAHSAPLTNANGQVTIPVLASEIVTNNDYSFIIKDPVNPARTTTFTVSPQAGNNTVDITMNPPVILSGRVLLSDGTPVAGAPVKWLNDGQYAGLEFAAALSATTNAQGVYSLQVPQGATGRLFVNTSRSPKNTAPTSPQIPWGLEYGGTTTVTESRTVDITLPPLHLLTFKAVASGTESPVVGAKLEFSGYTKTCKSPLPQAFPGATSPVCTFWPTGYAHSVGSTNGQGEVKIAVFQGSVVTNNTYSFLMRDPVDASKTRAFDITPTESSTTKVVMNPPVVVTGRVLLSDGTPVAGAPVKWLNDGQYAGLENENAITAVTNASGQYSIEIPGGNNGRLFVNTSRRPDRTAPTTPIIPWGLDAGGSLTLTQSRTIDITLPAQNVVTFDIKEWASNEPVGSAKVEFSGYTKTCKSGYVPFPGAANASCSFWPGGYAHSQPIANAQGQVAVALIQGSLITDNSYTWIVTHPIDNARVTRVTFSPTVSMTVPVVMPGTPSKPEQPNATPLTNEVRLTWTEPWNGGAFIDYYKVWISPNADGPFTLVTSGSCAGLVAPDQRTCVVTGLTPGVTYYFAIIAHNVVGYSQLSSATSATPLVAIGSFQQSASPTITGSAVVGQFLVATPGTWDSGTSFDYQWLLDGSAISGAIGSSYLVKAQDASKVISVRVTARKSGIESVTRTSGTMTPTWPTNGKLVDVSGTPAVGGMLTARASSLLGSAQVSYQWLRAGQPISGATLSYYEPTAEDAGEQLSVQLSSDVLTSVPTTIVQSETFVITSRTEAVAITRSGLIEAVTSNTTTTASPVVSESPTASPVATQSPTVSEVVSTSKPVTLVVQRTLSPFKPGAKVLTQTQRKAISDLLKANPTATKLVCTAVRTANTSKAKSLLLRKQAQQVCSYAVTQRKGLKVWVQSKVTTRAPLYGSLNLALR
jgi:subtilisin family serine protease/protocatechuate 3,4-dioxygenase beta subunit